MLELLPFIRLKKPVQSRDLAQKLGRMSFSEETDNQISEVNRLVRRYRYDEAEKILESILNSARERKD